MLTFHNLKYVLVYSCISLFTDIIIIFYIADIDECFEGDNCSQTCINTNGSFTCGCNSGYVLDSDGITCNGLYWNYTLHICYVYESPLVLINIQSYAS